MVFQKLQPYLMADFPLIKLERGMGRGSCAAQVRLRSAARWPSLIRGHAGTGRFVPADVDATLAREGQGRRCMQRLDVNPTAATRRTPSDMAGTMGETLARLGPSVLTTGCKFRFGAGALDAVEPAVSNGGRDSQNSKGRAVVDGDGPPWCSCCSRC
jgi:hypothetical protein